jgi:uncharacterized protein YyaL (SSP411 family)
VPAFYNLLQGSWAPSYPEITGYIIPSLWKWSVREKRLGEEAADSAQAMAEFLLRAQRKDGSFGGWENNSPSFAFDTAQVLQGLVATFRQTQEARYRDAALRAGEWLAGCQDEDGAWRRHQFGGKPKAYDARIGWILIEAGLHLGRRSWIDAGRSSLSWALGLQKANGWVAQCWLEPGEPAITHTIAYTIEGLLEGGSLLREERFVRAARETAKAVAGRQSPGGHVGAEWGEAWEPLSRYYCLTGDAQLSLCWLRLSQITGEKSFRRKAEDALAAVARVQFPGAFPPELAGGILGSWPAWGRYLRMKIPSWSCKFFLDACLLHKELTEETLPSPSR